MPERLIGGFKYDHDIADGLMGGGKAGVVRGAAKAVKGVLRKGDSVVNVLVKDVTGGTLSPQGTVALVCYAVMLITAAFSPVVAAQMNLSHIGVAALVVTLISVALTVYGINCMVVGGCERLSWVYVAVLLIWTVGVVAGTAFAKYSKPAKRFDGDVSSKLLPGMAADASTPLLPAPGDRHPGAPAAATPAQIADGTNRIVSTQRANLYEGYDAQGNDDNAPMPYVPGEMAAADSAA